MAHASPKLFVTKSHKVDIHASLTSVLETLIKEGVTIKVLTIVLLSNSSRAGVHWKKWSRLQASRNKKKLEISKVAQESDWVTFYSQRGQVPLVMMMM